MANIFKNISLSHQQFRNVLRFSQLWPNKHILYNNADAENRKTSTCSKINWKLPSGFSISSTKDQPPRQKKLQTITHKLKNNEQASECTIDDKGNLIYTKMQNHDPRITKIMSNIKKTNRKDGLMLLEGKNLIKEALMAKCQLEYILFSQLKDIQDLKSYLPTKTGKLYKMPYKEMQVWSDLITNPGIMGVFKIPPSDFFKPKDTLPITIICDNVREPSNLGAILRTSSGVGCKEVILTKGCVDEWQSKVLRTACGAHFRIKISKEVNWDNLRTKLPKNTNVFIADNKTLSSKTESNDTIEDLIRSIPILPYFSASFRPSNYSVLIIGGETEGISIDSYKLAKEFGGVRLNVPLSNGVDSLNTGTALGIIAFEIKRQLTNLLYNKVELKC